jgi:hypothetical protein
MDSWGNKNFGVAKGRGQDRPIEIDMASRIPDGPDGSAVYRVGTYAYVFLAAVVFFTLIGVLVVLPDAVRNPGNSVFDAIWLAILGWFWFNILRTPFEARISPDGLVHLRGLARRVVVAAAEIRQIRGISGGYGMRIEHTRGRIWLRMAFIENFEFLTRIRQLNPSVEIRGV